MATTAAVRIVDPVLTKLAQGYANNELVGDTIMPIVEIPKEAGKVPKFGRQAFRLPTTIRQVCGETNELSPEAITAVDVNTQEHDIAYPVDYREQNEASYPLLQYATNVTMDIISLGREKEIADLAQNADKYDSTNKAVLTGANQLTNPETDVFAIIDKGLQVIQSTIGRKPNVCVIAGDVWAVLKNHPKVVDKIKYSQKAIVTPELFAELIGIPVVKIGRAVFEDSDNVMKDIWTNTIILAYLPQNSQRGTVYEPAFGYTIRRQGGLSVDRYPGIGGKIEYVRTTDIYGAHLLGSAAGYLISGCVK